MKTLLLTLAVIGLPATSATADQKPQRAELIFRVSGLECSACVYSVQQAIQETKGVSEVEVMLTPDGSAKVAFDPRIVCEHQIAQAVREAFPLHGAPYLITLKLRIPRYATGGNAARVEAVFARWKKSVEIKAVDKLTGEFIIHFLPLDKDAKAAGPRGWSLAQLTHALKAPAPEGLGLDCVIGGP
jgi:copper chaperone CopZ